MAVDPKARFQQAKNLFKDGQFAEALYIATELDGAFPNTPTILWMRALCLERLGRGHEALPICDRLITHFNHEKAKQLKANLQGAQWQEQRQAPPQPAHPTFEAVRPAPQPPAPQQPVYPIFDAAPPAPPQGQQQPVYPVFGPPQPQQQARPPMQGPGAPIPGSVGGPVVFPSLDQPVPGGVPMSNDPLGLGPLPSLDAPILPMSSEPVVPPYKKAEASGSDSSWKTYAIIGAAVVGIFIVVTVGLAVFGGGDAAPGAAPASPDKPADIGQAFANVGIALVGRLTLFLLIVCLEYVTLVYLTLLFMNKLPNGELFSDLTAVVPVALGAALLANCCPCIGGIMALILLYKTYELEGLDLVILIVGTIGLNALNEKVIAPALAPEAQFTQLFETMNSQFEAELFVEPPPLTPMNMADNALKNGDFTSTVAFEGWTLIDENNTAEGTTGETRVGTNCIIWERHSGETDWGNGTLGVVQEVNADVSQAYAPMLTLNVFLNDPYYSMAEAPIALTIVYIDEQDMEHTWRHAFTHDMSGYYEMEDYFDESEVSGMPPAPQPETPDEPHVPEGFNSSTVVAEDQWSQHQFTLKQVLSPAPKTIKSVRIHAEGSDFTVAAGNILLIAN